MFPEAARVFFHTSKYFVPQIPYSVACTLVNFSFHPPLCPQCNGVLDNVYLSAGQHCWHPIAVMGVVDTFGQSLEQTWAGTKHGAWEILQISFRNFPLMNVQQQNICSPREKFSKFKKHRVFNKAQALEKLQNFIPDYIVFWQQSK